MKSRFGFMNLDLNTKQRAPILYATKASLSTLPFQPEKGVGISLIVTQKYRSRQPVLCSGQTICKH